MNSTNPLLAGAVGSHAQTTEVPGHLERFALQPDARQAVIAELAPGTPERFYFEALHLQHQRDTVALDTLLDRWRELHPDGSAQRTRIELREALLSQNDRVLRREAQDDIAGREVTIMGDKDIPYRLLKKVMATCTESDYGQISLAVLQKSSDKLDNIQAAL